MAPLSKREIKDIKSLASKKGRTEKNMFLAEGVRLLEQARSLKAKPQQVLYAPQVLSDRGLRLLDAWSQQGLTPRQVTSVDLEAVSDTRSPSGIAALFEIPRWNQEEPLRIRHRRILVCENVADPGNLGTLLRGALAFGFGTVLATGKTVDAYSPKVVRSSAGAIFGLTLRAVDEATLLAWQESNQAQMAVTVLSGQPLRQPLCQRMARSLLLLVVGSEAMGVSGPILDAATWKFRIKHRADVESLNVGMAGTIVMSRIYDASRK
ncbi:MAG: RNA methyltransferase [bacterium]